MSDVNGEARSVVAAATVTAACFIAVDLFSQHSVRSALIVLGTAGSGAYVAWRLGWRSGLGLLGGLVAVEGAFVALQLWWLAGVMHREGRLPEYVRYYVPFAALIGVHHGVLALGGGLAALSGGAVLRRLRWS